MTRAALAEERRDEIDESWEGSFLGAVPMASAHEERPIRLSRGVQTRCDEEFVWFIDARPQPTCGWGATEASASIWATSSLWHRLRRQSHENRRPKGGLR
jgi:hypothetical protein